LILDDENILKSVLLPEIKYLTALSDQVKSGMMGMTPY
jgi:hypothetical protein